MTQTPESILKSFSFSLPEERIARYPSPERDLCRLMVLSRKSQSISSLPKFRDIQDLLLPGDVLVFNSTRVSHRRIFLEHHSSQGKRIHEAIFLEGLDLPQQYLWKVLIRKSKKLEKGSILHLPKSGSELELIEKNDREWILRSSIPMTEEAFTAEGTVPIPPYLKRESDESDKTRYQTVFAKIPGSVAAPTAGLHFTEELKSSLEKKGVEFVEVHLQIGYGTFRPLETSDILQKKLHKETFTVSSESAVRLNLARKESRRIISIGTTSLRTLESVYNPRAKEFRPILNGETDLFLMPGDPILSIDGLITNFHLPESSLILLVAAFGGEELVKKAYLQAIQEEYNFYSYGDAMFLT